MLPAFGPGAFFVQRTDIAGQTPVNIGKVNEFSLDASFTKKELMGQNQFALFIARGTAKVTGKAKAALISGLAVNAVFFGLSTASGEDLVALTESHTVPASSPYTVAITPPGSGTFVADLGVIYGTNGLPLTVGTPSSAAGIYSEATGTYTFASGDEGKTVLITYLYNLSGTGQNIAITNQLIGTTPYFKAWYYTGASQPGGAVPLTIELNSCISDKLTMAFKLEDFMMPEFDFSCFADSSGTIGKMNFGEVS